MINNDYDQVKCCMTWEVKELDGEDIRKRPGGMMLRTTWKV